MTNGHWPQQGWHPLFCRLKMVVKFAWSVVYKHVSEICACCVLPLPHHVIMPKSQQLITPWRGHMECITCITWCNMTLLDQLMEAVMLFGSIHHIYRWPRSHSNWYARTESSRKSCNKSDISETAIHCLMITLLLAVSNSASPTTRPRPGAHVAIL